jgi:hypothetical protein
MVDEDMSSELNERKAEVPASALAKKVKVPKATTYFFANEGQIMQFREIYYRDDRVLFLMIPYMHGRELALISASGQFTNARHMKAHNLAFLKSNFNAFDFLHKDYMVYYSLAMYQDHPAFSYNPIERKRQQDEWVNGVKNEAGERISKPLMAKYVTGYDLAFDLDAHGKIYKDVRKSPAYRECRVLRDELRAWGVKYRITFSGSGWHLVVPYEQFRFLNLSVVDFDFMKEGNVYEFCARVRTRIVNMLGLGSVDLTIVDAARVFKMPWSLTKYGTVAVPMADDKMFDNFDINLTDPRKVLGRTDLIQRGVEWTNQGTPSGFEAYLKKRLKKW